MRIRYAFWHCAAFVCLAGIVAVQYVIVSMFIARYTSRFGPPSLTIGEIFVLAAVPIVYELKAGALLMGAFGCWKRASKLHAAPRVTLNRNRQPKETRCPRSTATTT